MSVTSLPIYQNTQSPVYSRNPLATEHRVVLQQGRVDNVLMESEGTFSKSSKTTGSLTLQIFGQEQGATAPVFNKGTLIHGKVLTQKRDTVSSVDIKLEGFLRLQQVGGAGRSMDKILDQQLNLWSRDQSSSCPSSLDFTVPLQQSYSTNGQTYALPPSYEVHLSGLPGFRADVYYTITATVTKTKGSLFGNHTVVSTPFIYLPRARPQRALPSVPTSMNLSPILSSNHPDWEVVESIIGSRSQHTSPILTKLCIPTGRTFSIKSPIPFVLHISSTAFSLAHFLPCSPTANGNATPNKVHDSKRGVTRVYIIRQSSVDVKSMQSEGGGNKTDIFRITAVGEGTFQRLGDGADWAAWQGEIHLEENLVKVGSFSAGGLAVRDCIILSVIPPNPHNSPLMELRATVPIRLVTESAGSDADYSPVDWSGDIKYDFPPDEDGDVKVPL